MEDYGLVSIIMPAYNSEKYIKTAIDSVLSQTYTNFEFIIINDGSKDRTKEIIKSYNDPRIVFIDLPENKGVSYARNVALDIVRGKWIAFIDADDFWRPERLAYLLGIISKYEYNKYFIGDDIIVFYETRNGNKIFYGSRLKLWTYKINRELRREINIIYDNDDILNLAFHPVLPSQIIKESNLKFPENLNFAEDLYFYIKICKFGLKMIFARKALYFQRITPGSLTDLKFEELSHRIETFKTVINNDKDFSEEEKELLNTYFIDQLRIAKVSIMKNYISNLKIHDALLGLKDNPEILKEVIKSCLYTLTNPYKLFNKGRLLILSKINGGLLRS